MNILKNIEHLMLLYIYICNIPVQFRILIKFLSIENINKKK